jgi:3-mercaptopyruvate sulfurtransferase SseA
MDVKIFGGIRVSCGKAAPAVETQIVAERLIIAARCNFAGSWSFM